jgi:hypothetical protein
MIAAACGYLYGMYTHWHQIPPVSSYWNLHGHHLKVLPKCEQVKPQVDTFTSLPVSSKLIHVRRIYRNKCWLLDFR